MFSLLVEAHFQKQAKPYMLTVETIHTDMNTHKMLCICVLVRLCVFTSAHGDSELR